MEERFTNSIKRGSAAASLLVRPGNGRGGEIGLVGG